MENLLLTNITDIPSPFGIFKLTTYHDFEGLLNSYMVLCFKGKKEYTFGRNSMADIGVDDYHISKLNTEMRYSNGNESLIQIDSSFETKLLSTVPCFKYVSLFASTKQISQKS